MWIRAPIEDCSDTGWQPIWDIFKSPHASVLLDDLTNPFQSERARPLSNRLSSSGALQHRRPFVSAQDQNRGDRSGVTERRPGPSRGHQFESTAIVLLKLIHSAVNRFRVFVLARCDHRDVSELRFHKIKISQRRVKLIPLLAIGLLIRKL